MIGWLAVGVLALQAAPVEPVEVIPDFFMADQLEVEGRTLKLGMIRDDVVRAMGPGTKVDKGEQMSAAKLEEQQRLVLRLSPWRAPLVERFSAIAPRCESGCWMSGAKRKLTKKDTIIVGLMGPDRDHMEAVWIAIDRGSSSLGKMVRRAWRDAAEDATYVLTDDQVYRIGQVGNVVRVEKMK